MLPSRVNPLALFSRSPRLARGLASEATVANPIPYYKRFEATVSSPFPTEVQTFLYDFHSAAPLGLSNLPAAVFGVNPVRRDLLQRAAVWQRDGMREGNAATKGISDIRGSSRKQAPQKGRGKARMHSRRAPNFRGGATIFGPKPRDHATGLQSKVYLAALRSALSAKLAQDELTLVNKLALPSPKSAGFREVLGAFGWEGALMIGGAEEEVWDTSLMLASRNFPFVDFIPAEEADVLRILKHERVVMDEEALAILVERLSVD